MDGRNLVGQRDGSFGYCDGFALGVEGLSVFDLLMSLTNNLPVDTAFRVNAKSAAGTLTVDDLEDARAGFKQASDAKQDADAFVKLSPGAASTEYIQSTNALFTAAKLALQKVEAMASGTIGNNAQKQAVTPQPPQQRASERPLEPVPQPAQAPRGFKPAPNSTTGPLPTMPTTVNINLNGRPTTIKVASLGDSEALIGLLRELENGRGTAQ